MTGSPSPLPRLSAPATRALAAAGITDLRQLDGLPGAASPRDWIAELPTARRAEDGLRLLELFDDATGAEAVTWAGSIVGYGHHHHYVYDSGRDGDTFVVGFSPGPRA